MHDNRWLDRPVSPFRVRETRPRSGSRWLDDLHWANRFLITLINRQGFLDWVEPIVVGFDAQTS